MTKDGAAEPFVGAQAVTVTPELFDTLGVRLEQGRTFTANEFANPQSDAIVINESLAKRLWPGQSALERRVGVATADPRTDGVSWRRVVGVAPDLVYEELGEQTEPARLNVYFPYARSPLRTMAFLIRGDGNPAALMEPARRALRQVHGGFAAFDVATMSERRRLTNGEERAFGTMMGGFATAALLLACLGIYGLLADTARQRRPEIGVRLAFGATPRNILVLFVRQAAIIGAAGVVIGTVLAMLLAQALSGVLFGIDPLAMMPIVLNAVVLIAVVLIAAVRAGPPRVKGRATRRPQNRIARDSPLRAARLSIRPSAGRCGGFDTCVGAARRRPVRPHGAVSDSDLMNALPAVEGIDSSFPA